jgi:hypothetical protein
MAIDDQVVFTAELAMNVVERLAHFASNFAPAEIGSRLITENRFVGVKMRMYGSFDGCHGEPQIGNIILHASFSRAPTKWSEIKSDHRGHEGTQKNATEAFGRNPGCLFTKLF